MVVERAKRIEDMEMYFYVSVKGCNTKGPGR